MTLVGRSKRKRGKGEFLKQPPLPSSSITPSSLPLYQGPFLLSPLLSAAFKALLPFCHYLHKPQLLFFAKQMQAAGGEKSKKFLQIQFWCILATHLGGDSHKDRAVLGEQTIFFFFFLSFFSEAQQE